MAGTEFFGFRTRKKGAKTWGRLHGGYTSYSSAKEAGKKAIAGSDTYEMEVVSSGSRSNIKNNWF